LKATQGPEPDYFFPLPAYGHNLNNIGKVFFDKTDILLSAPIENLSLKKI
jgi:hypothetical protein